MCTAARDAPKHDRYQPEPSKEELEKQRAILEAVVARSRQTNAASDTHGDSDDDGAGDIGVESEAGERLVEKHKECIRRAKERGGKASVNLVGIPGLGSGEPGPHTFGADGVDGLNGGDFGMRYAGGGLAAQREEGVAAPHGTGSACVFVRLCVRRGREAC